MFSFNKLIELLLMTLGTSGLGGHLGQVSGFFTLVLGSMTNRAGNIIITMFTALPVFDQQRSNCSVTLDTDFSLFCEGVVYHEEQGQKERKKRIRNFFIAITSSLLIMLCEQFKIDLFTIADQASLPTTPLSD